jgi:hypothetical protein
MELSDDLPSAHADDAAPTEPQSGADVAVGVRPALLVFDDAARSPNPAVCPFFRFALDGDLVAPLLKPDEGNRCAAIGAPRPESARQQELVCLTPAHADCPRYLRGALALQDPAAARRPAAVPRATLAALLILVLSAGISFGFVVQRGGIELPVVAGAPSSTTLALAASPVAAPTATPNLGPTPAPTPLASVPASAAAVSVPPSASPTVPPSPSPTPSPSPSPTPSPTASPSPTPVLTPSATPPPTPKPTKKPTSDRYKLLDPCPDRSNCYLYTVRSGDNLYSIAHYFGVPLATIYAWNPAYANGAHLKVGNKIRMPPPTR